MHLGQDFRIKHLEGRYWAVFSTVRSQMVRDFATVTEATQWLENKDKEFKLWLNG